MIGNNIGYNIFNGGIIGRSILLNSLYLAYKARVEADSGSILDEEKTNTVFSQFALLLPNTELLWAGIGGTKLRYVAPQNFIEDAYDFSTNNNDLTQSSSGSQPYLTGDIAPTENEGMKNPNGDTRYVTHDEISFTSSEPWTVTTCLNWEGTEKGASWYVGKSDTNTPDIIGVRNNSNNEIRVINSSGTSIIFSFDSSIIIGKNSIISIVANTTEMLLYVNGVYVDTQTIGSDFIFNSFFQAYTSGGFYFYGTISYHRIQSGAMSTTEVANEAAFLQTLYPEVPSVTIGTQEWTTSNCDMVATPMGTVIPEVTDAATWATSQTIYDDAITGGATVYEATEAAAMWCYYNNDSSLGATYGKLYNWFAVSLLQQDIDLYNAANPTAHWGYHVPSSTEFTTLQTYLGGSSVAGGKMKKEGLDYWNTPNTGADNSSGFSALPSGVRTSSSYSSIEGAVAMWTINKYRLVIFSGNSTSSIQDRSVQSYEGYSLRLIKD